MLVVGELNASSLRPWHRRAVRDSPLDSPPSRPALRLSSRTVSIPGDATLTEHTVANTHAYTRIPGLDDGRPIFAIVAFEGVLNFSGEAGRMHFRVQAHLL